MGEYPDLKSGSETDFLTRLSGCHFTDSWEMHRHTLVSGACVCLLPRVLCSQGHLMVFQVQFTPSCLTEVFLATSAVPSLSISRAPPSGLGLCGKVHPPSCPRTCLLQDGRQDVLLRAGVPLFQLQLLPTKLE